MATQADVRRIALSLPGVTEQPDRFGFTAIDKKGKACKVVWVWLERVHPRKARVPQPKVLCVRTASLDDKEFLLASDPRKFFADPHYDGFPAVQLRLDEVTVPELRHIVTEARRTVASPK